MSDQNPAPPGAPAVRRMRAGRILGRLTQAVQEQNWFAVALELLIVVVGVFIGIQVSNWNDARAFDARETDLLVELRSELEGSIRTTEQKAHAISQVASAWKRSLDFMAAGEPCGDDCWSRLVDFFHASQWQPIDVPRSTYDEMRRDGLPRSREIIDAVELYLAQSEWSRMDAGHGNIELIDDIGSAAMWVPEVRHLTVVVPGYELQVIDMSAGENASLDLEQARALAQKVIGRLN